MAGNIFQAGAQGFADADNMARTIQTRRAGYQAAPRVAAGDYTGAAQAYGQAGMADEARQMVSDQQGVDQQQYQHDRQGQQDERAQAEKRIETLSKIAQGLKSVPAGQRRAALDHVMPIFGKLGMDGSQFETLTEDHLTDNDLDVFSGELDKQWQAVNMGGGGVGAFNPHSGDFKTLREPTQKAPLGYRYGAGGEMEIDPGYLQGRADIAKATRAPLRPRAGGGGGKPQTHGAGLDIIESELRKRGLIP